MSPAEEIRNSLDSLKSDIVNEMQRTDKFYNKGLEEAPRAYRKPIGSLGLLGAPRVLLRPIFRIITLGAIMGLLSLI